MTAEPGAIAIGRDLVNSTLNVGISPEQLEGFVRERTRLLEENIALLKESWTSMPGRYGLHWKLLE